MWHSTYRNTSSLDQNNKAYKSYRHAVYACLQITVNTSGSQVIQDKNKPRNRYNNVHVSLTVDLPVNAKMLKEFMSKSIWEYRFYGN